MQYKICSDLRKGNDSEYINYISCIAVYMIDHNDLSQIIDLMNKTVVNNLKSMMFYLVILTLTYLMELTQTLKWWSSKIVFISLVVYIDKQTNSWGLQKLLLTTNFLMYHNRFHILM